MFCKEEQSPYSFAHQSTLYHQHRNELNDICRASHHSQLAEIRLVNNLIFSVFLYGCESWTIRKKERKKIDALELWCWRKLLKISWIDKITNANVLAQIQPVISLKGKVNKQKLSYFGHIMRSEDSLEKSILVGKCEGERKRGRQRMRWLGNVKEVTGKDLKELKEMVQDKSN